MAFFYMDTDTGDDADDGTTWALAKLTLEGLLAVMSAGDTGFVQGAADDTVAASRTFTSPGTVIFPCKIIGVVDGTTNTGTSVVAGDLAVTLPVISNSGSASDINFDGVANYSHIKFISADWVTVQSDSCISFTNAHLSNVDRVTIETQARLILTNTIREPTATTAVFKADAEGDVCVSGSTFTFTAAASIIRSTCNGTVSVIACDLSGLTASITQSAGATCKATFKNCSMPSSFTLYGATPTELGTFVELIGCSDASSVAATDSIQDYQYQDIHGTIDGEFTAVRTGGADDDATGAFAYAMTPAADATLESSGATLKSPWCSVWVDGGSNTLTMYIANDSASTDYNQDEAWVEFYTPDAGDTAQYDQTFDAGDARLVDSTTAITDDTGSTWGTGANNHQKFSATVTTGYTGWAYARLHLAKRDATPDTLFLDPRIEVS